MKRILLGAAFASVLSLAVRAETLTMHATLNGATEVPPKTTQGTGTGTFTFDTATRALTYEVTYQNLSGPATAGHLHGPAASGANAGVAVPFPAPLTSPIKGTATLTEAQAKDLVAGMYYANIHTAANPAGEIRGQVTR